MCVLHHVSRGPLHLFFALVIVLARNSKIHFLLSNLVKIISAVMTCMTLSLSRLKTRSTTLFFWRLSSSQSCPKTKSRLSYHRRPKLNFKISVPIFDRDKSWSRKRDQQETYSVCIPSRVVILLGPSVRTCTTGSSSATTLFPANQQQAQGHAAQK